MPPRHNPTIRRVRTRPNRNRGHRPAPPPARELTPEDVAELREFMKIQLGGREPRTFQLDLVQAQEERRDALCQAATGQGKTAVAAGPYALEKNAGRVTLMVSPLIGLQNEMAETFKDEFKLSAIAVNSSTKGGCSSELVTEIVNGKYQIVLLSPEMLLSSPFINGVLRHPEFASRIYSVIIDEAHCISHWGADFRKQYGQIGMIRVFLPRDTPIIALSASLTERVIQDIVHTLQLDRSNYLFRNLGNDRDNVSLVVRAIHNSQSSYSDLNFLIPPSLTSSSDIPKIWIYADNIDVGTDIIDHLRSLLPDEYHDSIRPYNAVHDDEYRKRAMELFREGTIRILVCTDAAGMGCNIPDIDVVVQWKLPAKLSSFVQRAGRAARNPTRQGLAVLLVEPAAYLISTSMKNIEAPAKGLKGKKSGSQGKAKGQGFWKKATVKGYAASRGRFRGGRTCQDAITACDEPPFERDDPSEGLYSFLQATTCRRNILRKVFNNPKPNPTVPCCDICEPKLLDRTRPGIRKVSRGRGIQYSREPCDSLLVALDHWRDNIMARDEPQSLFPSSSILPDPAVEKLAKLALPLTSSNIQNFLAPQWPLWEKYGQELTSMMLDVDIHGQVDTRQSSVEPSNAVQAKGPRSSAGIDDVASAALPNHDQQDSIAAPTRKKARTVRSKPQLVKNGTSSTHQSAAFQVDPQPAFATSEAYRSSLSTLVTERAQLAMRQDVLFHTWPPARAPIVSTSSLPTTPSSLSVSASTAPVHQPSAITPTPATHGYVPYPKLHPSFAPVQAPTVSRQQHATRYLGPSSPASSSDASPAIVLSHVQHGTHYTEPPPPPPFNAGHAIAASYISAPPQQHSMRYPGPLLPPPSSSFNARPMMAASNTPQPQQRYVTNYSGPPPPSPLDVSPAIASLHVAQQACQERTTCYPGLPPPPPPPPFNMNPAVTVSHIPQQTVQQHAMDLSAPPPPSSFDVGHTSAASRIPPTYPYSRVAQPALYTDNEQIPSTTPAKYPGFFTLPATPTRHYTSPPFLSPYPSFSHSSPYGLYAHQQNYQYSSQQGHRSNQHRN